MGAKDAAEGKKHAGQSSDSDPRSGDSEAPTLRASLRYGDHLDTVRRTPVEILYFLFSMSQYLLSLRQQHSTGLSYDQYFQGRVSGSPTHVAALPASTI